MVQSEEDLQLKGELEMLVERLRVGLPNSARLMQKEPDTSLYAPALESLRTLIRTSTSSMTSVPKPLKFLRPHYEEMGRLRSGWSETLKEQRVSCTQRGVSSRKALIASILSVLAMTYSDTGKRETLSWRMTAGTEEDPGSWGHEYVRHLASELGEEYNLLVAPPMANGLSNGKEEVNGDAESHPKYDEETLRDLGLVLVRFFLKHNAEADAVDLLLELEVIEKLADEVDEANYSRVCQYIIRWVQATFQTAQLSCVPLLTYPDDQQFLRTGAKIYGRFDRYPEALAVAIRLNDRELVREYFDAPKNP